MLLLFLSRRIVSYGLGNMPRRRRSAGEPSAKSHGGPRCRCLKGHDSACNNFCHPEHQLRYGLLCHMEATSALAVFQLYSITLKSNTWLGAYIKSNLAHSANELRVFNKHNRYGIIRIIGLPRECFHSAAHTHTCLCSSTRHDI